VRIHLGSVRSGWRLGIGGVLLPFALNRGCTTNECDLISVDIFGTLLARMGDDDAAWTEGALHAAEVARTHGLPTEAEPVMLRRTVESRLSRVRLTAGKDPEFCHQQVLEEMLLEWGAGRWASEKTAALAN